jgi:hypothetical protein
MHMLVNLREDHVLDLEIVLVLKQHVAVSERSGRGQGKHGRISSGFSISRACAGKPRTLRFISYGVEDY